MITWAVVSDTPGIEHKMAFAGLKSLKPLADLLGEFSDRLVTEVNMGDDLATQESVMVIEGPS
jgi:hypothetical protein